MRVTPIPDWIKDAIEETLQPKQAFERHSNTLEQVYNAGNLGALKDIVYWAQEYKQILPDWATKEIYKSLNALALNDQKFIYKWKKWADDYKQYVIDYERYACVDFINKTLKATWIESYEHASIFLYEKFGNRHKVGADTIKSSYLKVKDQLENYTNPYPFRTFLKKDVSFWSFKDYWLKIKNKLKKGKPKKINRIEE